MRRKRERTGGFPGSQWSGLSGFHCPRWGFNAWLGTKACQPPAMAKKKKKKKQIADWWEEEEDRRRREELGRYFISFPFTAGVVFWRSSAEIEDTRWGSQLTGEEEDAQFPNILGRMSSGPGGRERRASAHNLLPASMSGALCFHWRKIIPKE